MTSKIAKNRDKNRVNCYNKIMKAILIQAALPVKYLSIPPPIGVAYLASYLLKDGVDVRIIDAYVDNLQTHEIVKKVIDEKPDFVGVSRAAIATLAVCCD